MRGFSLALLLFSLTFAAPAFAQPPPPPEPTPQAPPPVRSAIDENGVDVTRGTFTFDQPGVSIGPAYPHGLSFANRDYGEGTSPGVVSSLEQFGSTFVATVGGDSDSFTLSGSTYTPTEANGATLTKFGAVYTYTSGNGMVARFTEVVAWGRPLARPDYVQFPDGTRVVYTHRNVSNYCPGGLDEGQCYVQGGYRLAYRLQSITNNHGYQLKINYATNTLNDLNEATTYAEWTRLVSVTAINNAVDYCDPTADTCTGLTQSWPTVTYGSSSAGATITDAAGQVTTYTASSSTSTGIRLPGSTADDISVTTNSGGEVTSITQFGVTHTYAVSTTSTERTTTVTDPLNATRVYVTELANMRLKSFTDELSRTTGYQYDTNARLTRVTAHLGNYTAYEYDARGNIVETRQVAQSGSNLPAIVTTASYDGTCSNPVKCNRPNYTIDARGYRTSYTYDDTHGGVTSVTGVDPATGLVCTSTSGTCPQTRTTYDTRQAYYHQTSSGGPSASGTNIYVPYQISSCAVGNASSCVSSGNEVRTTIGWGPQTTGTANNLLPVSTTSGDGGGNLSATASATYDAIGNMTTLDGPLAGTDDTTTFRYDAARRRVGAISPDPDGSGLPMLRRAQRITYATTGLVEQVEQGTVTGTSDSAWALFAALQSVHFTYDARRRVVRQALGAANAFQAVRDLQYDAFNRVECVATRMNPASWSGLTAGCSLQTTGSDGPDRISRTLYTLAGELYQQQAAYNTPLATIVSISSYTMNGRLATLTDANNNVTTYTHDGHDRLRRTCYAQTASSACATATGTGFEQFTYEDTVAGSEPRTSGLIASRLLRDGRSIAYTHDPLGRLTLKDVPAGGYADGDISYAYDLLGRRLSATSTAGGTATDSLWSWDALGRMIAEDSGFGWNTLTYDLAGRLTRHTFTDGFYVDYDHLVTGEVIRVRENGVSSSVTSCNNQSACVLAAFAYDDLGRRTSLTRGNGTSASYAYSPAANLSQLAESIPGTAYGQTIDFLYNRAGQIRQRDSTNTNYSYTARTNGTVTDTVNALNQITQTGSTTVTHDANGNTSAIGSDSYSYTSENRLATAPGVSLPYWASGMLSEVYENSTVRTMFEYVNGNMVSERDATGALTHRYVRGPGVDEVLVEYLGTDTSARRFLHADERGSIVALTNDTGGMIAVNAYDEYGVPAASNTGRFQYTGQPWIAQVGMYYYRARFYNPRLGRFMQTDPIGYGGGMNLYAYVGGDPVNLTDPSGLTANDRPCFTGGPFVCPPIDVIGHGAPAGMYVGVISRGSGNRSGEIGPGSGGTSGQTNDEGPDCDPQAGQNFRNVTAARNAAARAIANRDRSDRSSEIEYHANVFSTGGGNYTFSINVGPVGGQVPFALGSRSSLWSIHNHPNNSFGRRGMLSSGVTNRVDFRRPLSDIGSYELFFEIAEQSNPNIRDQLGVGLVDDLGNFWTWDPGDNLNNQGESQGSVRCD